MVEARLKMNYAPMKSKDGHSKMPPQSCPALGMIYSKILLATLHKKE